MSSIPTVEKGSPLGPGGGGALAPGVSGYAIRENGVLWIPFIAADNPGNGDVRRFLDALPRDETVRFPTVLSAILAGALERRGFSLQEEFDPEIGETVEFYERRATP